MFLRKSNGHFNGSISDFRFSFLERLLFTFAAALLLVFSLLIIAGYVKHYAATVMEVWASFDQQAYVQYIERNAPEDPAKILAKIAKCESGGKHFKTDGTLMKHVNKDGSVDYGLYMINDKRHEKTAAKLGMNIYTEEGNEAYAMHLYENQGTEPWLHSKKCWTK